MGTGITSAGNSWLPMGAGNSPIVYQFQDGDEFQGVDLPQFESGYDYRIECLVYTLDGIYAEPQFLLGGPVPQSAKMYDYSWKDGWLRGPVDVNPHRRMGGIIRMEFENPRALRSVIDFQCDVSRNPDPGEASNVPYARKTHITAGDRRSFRVQMGGVDTGATPGFDYLKQVRIRCGYGGYLTDARNSLNPDERTTFRMWKRRTGFIEL